MTRLPSTWAVTLIGIALVLCSAVGLAVQGWESMRPAVGAALVHGAVYALAVWLVLRHPGCTPVVLILGIAVLLRLVMLAGEPFLSDDIYRYVWDGRVQATGINPYRHVPADPALTALRDAAIFPNINRSDYAVTIYPPAAQMVFLAATRVSEAVTWMRLVMVACEALALWAVWRLLREDGLPADRLLIYAWHPLPVWEIAGSGHVDAAMLAACMLAVLAGRRGRDALAGVALAAATLVKLYPIVLVPALWRRGDRHLPAAFAAAVIVAYLPYLSVGAGVLGFMPGYVAEEGLVQGQGFWIADLALRLSGFAIPPLAYLAVAALVMTGVALRVMTALPPAERPVAGSLALSATTLVALSPHFAWYFLWLIPFLCVRPSWPILWLTLSAFLLYWSQVRAELWVGAVIYGGFAVLAAAGLLRRPRPTVPIRSTA